MEISPRTGRPKVDKPKNKVLQIRMDNETLERLNLIAEIEKCSKSYVIRKGIEIQYEKIKK